MRFAREGAQPPSSKVQWFEATQDQYILGARGGQTMIVHITSRENNAVFVILGADGTALDGAEEGTDAKDWTGRLPLVR